MNRKKTGRPTLHPRKWRRISPCPVCHQWEPSIAKQGRFLDRQGQCTMQMYFCWCPGCHHGIAALTGPDEGFKGAIRQWNFHANTTKGRR